MALIEFTNGTGAPAPKISKENKPEKKLERIVKSEVKIKRRSFARQFMDEFIQEDAESVKDYLISESIAKIKSFMWEMITGTVDMAFWGNGAPPVSGRIKKSGSSYSYNSIYNQKNQPSHATSRRKAAFEDLEFDERWEAEEVIDTLVELLETYDTVSVADLYELVGITGNHTDYKYGWENISGYRIERVGRKYVLHMPKATAI